MTQYFFEKSGPNDYRVYSTDLSGSKGDCLGMHKTKRAAMAQIDKLNIAALKAGK